MTPFGSKRIEQLRVGDQVISKPDWNANGAVRVQTVEEVFRLQAPILKLRIGGQTIETTAEHPFYVDGKGWTDGCDLKIGDQLIGSDGTLTPVESVDFTGEIKPVYNLRVSQDHTYFVGSATWGFSVWVHNVYRLQLRRGGKWAIKNITTGKWVRNPRTNNIRTFGTDKARVDKFLGSILDKLNKVHNRIDPKALINALLKFKSKGYQFGKKKIVLHKSGLTHILERHHPKYITTPPKSKQTNFPKNMSIDKIRNLMGEILKQNTTAIRNNTTGNGQFLGIVNGVVYQIGIKKWKMVNSIRWAKRKRSTRVKDIVKSFFKIEDRFIPINEFEGKLPDDFYIDGAIICTIEGHKILTFKHWDLVDQLWYYIIEGLIELRAKRDFECYFPDQPLLYSFKPQEKGMVKITIDKDPYTVNAERFIKLAAENAIEFFLKMKVLLPRQNSDWDLHLGRAKSLL